LIVVAVNIAQTLSGDSSLEARLISEAPGPIFFAWVDPTETTFGPQHHRLDEDAFQFQVRHAENDFAGLSLRVRNPRVGLLGAGRKVWAWLSWRDPLGNVHPLFFGRLLGVPKNFFDEIVTLLFIARPRDFVAQKATLANSLKVLPYWDAAFIAEDKRNDPDNALAARSAFWHIDRLTGLVTISDVLTGEDGIEEFYEADADVFSDTVQPSDGNTPVRALYLEATANWTQSDTGERHWLTYTAASFINDWPKPLSDFGGGWSAEVSTIEDLNKVSEQISTHSESSWTNHEKTHENGDQLSANFSMDMPSYVTDINQIGKPFQGGVLPNYLSHEVHREFQTGVLDPGDTLSEVFGDNETVNIPMSDSASYMFVPLSRLHTTLQLRYTAARARSELGVFAMSCDVQPLLTLDAEAEPQRMQFTSVPLDKDLGIWGSAPLVGPLSGYFGTPRGILSAYYIMLTGRAMLRFYSRAIDFTWSTTLERALAMTCRKSARLHWRKLPGGAALGKVIEYTLNGDGDSGEFFGTVKIGCAIGRGGTAVAAAGDPTYAAAGYMQPGYQQMDGQVNLLPTSDIGLTTPYISGTDDGLVFPLSRGQVELLDQTTGDAETQAYAIEAGFLEDEELATLSANPTVTVESEKRKAQAKARTAAEVMKVTPVKWELRLKPVNGGPFNTTTTMFPTVLKIEKGIDLEATS
jgi:hypothetical protein